MMRVCVTEVGHRGSGKILWTTMRQAITWTNYEISIIRLQEPSLEGLRSEDVYENSFEKYTLHPFIQAALC